MNDIPIEYRNTFINMTKICVTFTFILRNYVMSNTGGYGRSELL